jgi:5-methyltetrahydrofolate corrinoid/iron sulfur protein methyltransferase
MIVAADNLQILQPDIRTALEQEDPEPIQELVRRCVKAGAQAIDINSGPLQRAPERKFAFLVEAVQSVTPLPLLLDTINPAALKAGLEVCRNPVMINGFSLEPARLKRILPLAITHEADIIGYLLYPDSRVPDEEAEMMTLAVTLFNAACGHGIPAHRLIIDPVVAPMSWENGIRHNQAVLSTIRHLPDLLDAPVRTIAGLSNLGAGHPSAGQRIALESAFLPMLAGAGLQIALLNIFHSATVQTARACEALLSQKVFSWAALALDE